MTVSDEMDLDPFLSGPYRPVTDELDVAPLQVSGALPPSLNGSFLRNGPNPMFPPAGEYHIFDGDGMLHEVALDGGTARYRNRWIRSRGLEAERRAGTSLYGGMANAQFPGPEVVGDAGAIKNVANTNVLRHAGRILCLWEGGRPTVVTPELDTVGTTDFDGRLRGSMTAHPKIDPVTGEMFAFGYSALPPYLRYHRFDAAGSLVDTVDIDLPAPVMMHDFAVTDRHVVFLDAPAVFDLARFGAGGPMIAWEPDRGTRLGVMRRDGDGSDLRWIEIDNCYVFHFLNAWSEPADGGADGDGRVVVDAARLPFLDIGLDDGAERPEGSSIGHLSRFVIDLDAGDARWDRVAERTGDFPRIDERRAGRRHRHGYLATFSDPRLTSEPGVDGQFDSVTAFDLDAGSETAYRVGAGRMTGEPVFAPDPDRDGEGAGWVLSFVYDAARDSSEVIVLDAADVAAGPVATIHLPRRVPFGFHGSWLPDE